MGVSRHWLQGTSQVARQHMGAMKAEAKVVALWRILAGVT